MYEFLRDNWNSVLSIGRQGYEIRIVDDNFTFAKTDNPVRYWVAGDVYLIMMDTNPLCSIPKDSSDLLSHKLRLMNGDIKSPNLMYDEKGFLQFIIW